MEIAYDQIVLQLFTCLLIASLLAILFKLRTVFGLGLLLITLGVFQLLQILMAKAFLVEIAAGIFVSTGSTILFTAGLFMVLVIYIREDALETRKIIYALLTANILTFFLLLAFGWLIENEIVTNVYKLPTEFFTENARILFIGTAIFLADVLALILLYEFISKYVGGLFFRILFTMSLALTFDTILFTVSVFWSSDNFLLILFTSLISKIVAGLIYSGFFSYYLIYFDEKSMKIEGKLDTFKDIFNTLTFRQKYENVFEEMKIKTRELLESQKIARLGSYSLDIESGYWESSKVLDEIFGIDQDYNRDVMGWIQLVDPRDQAMMQNYFEVNILIKHEKFNKKYRILRPSNNRECWVHGMGELMFNDDKKPIKLVGTIQDITERKEAESKLIESENKFSKTFYNNPIPISISNIPNGKIIDVNPMFEKLSGYSRKEILGKTGVELDFYVNPEDRDKLYDILSSKGYLKGEELRFKSRKGNVVESLVYADIVEMNNELCLISIVHDITELNNANKIIENSEKQFRELYEKSGDAILIIENEKFIECNQATVDMLEYESKDEFLNSHPSKLSPELQPDGKNSFDKAIEMMNTALQQGTHRFEWIHTKKTGENFPVEVLLTSISNEPNNQVIHTVWRDITDRKKAELEIKMSERELRDSQEIAQLGTYNFNISTQEFVSSSIFDSIVGFKEGDKKTFDIYKDMVHPEDFDLNEKMLKDCIKNSTKFEREYRIFNFATKELVWLNGFGEIIFNERKEMIFKGTIQDITKRKKNEERIRRSNAILNQLNSLVKVIDKNGAITYASPSFKTILGYEIEEILDQGWWLRTTPDLKSARELRDYMLEIASETGSLSSKLRDRWIKTKDGEHKLIEWVSSKGEDGSIILTGIDVTEKQLAEESSAQYWKIVEESLNEIYIADVETLKFIKVNRGARNNTGYSAKEFSNMSPLDLMPNWTKGKLNKILKPLITDKVEKLDFDIEHQRKNGTTYKAEMNLQKSEINQKPVLVASVKDITQEQRNEKIKQIIFNITKKSNDSSGLGELFYYIKTELGKLINTDNFFIALYDEKTQMVSTPYMVDEYDTASDFPKGKTLTGHVIDTKEALLTKYARVKKESKDKKILGIGPASKCWLGVPILINDQSIGAIVVQSYIDENAYNEGDVILLELVASSIGQIIRKVEYLEQIKLFSQALIHTPAIVMITNTKGELEFINDAFTKELGFEFDEVIGNNPNFLNPDIKLNEFYLDVRKSIAKKGYWQDEIVNVKKNGDKIIVSASIAPFTDDDQKLSHYIIVEEDITEKRKLERQFVNAIIEAQDIEKQNFGEELHDSISQILSAESMYIDLLIDQNKDRLDGKAKFLTKIKELNNTAINETRNIAHGLMSNQLKQSGLLVSVENICIDFSSKKEIEFKFENDGVVEKDLSQEIKINLFRVIQELSTNINRYSSATEAKISFSKLNKKLVKVVIEDNGIGMDYDKVKNQSNGTGLQTVKRRVTFLNGKFDVKSVLKKGTRYTLEIPLS